MLEWRMAGITFRLSVWFPASVIVILSLDGSGLTMNCLLASIAHEIGHFLAMLCLRDRPSRITLGIFGMRVERRHDGRLGYPALCAVSLCGPLTNALCALLLWRCAPEVALIHSVLAVFHLLPVVSLDGGEAVYDLLCLRLDEDTADRVIRCCSFVLLCFLTALGGWLLLASGYNFTLLVVCVYLFLRMFLREGH